MSLAQHEAITFSSEHTLCCQTCNSWPHERKILIAAKSISTLIAKYTNHMDKNHVVLCLNKLIFAHM